MLTISQEEARELTNQFAVQEAEKREKALQIYSRYVTDREAMMQSYRFFRNRTPQAYWDDGDKRFNYYKEKDVRKHGWQNNVFDPVTHDKTIAIVAGIAATRMGVRIKPRKQKTYRALFQSSVLNSIYEFTETVQTNGDADHFFDILEAVTKGTSIRFEGFQAKTLKRKVITGQNEETGEIQYKEVDEYQEGILSQRVHLQDFIPGNIYEFDMEKQTHCYWRSVVSMAEFLRDWSSWTDADKVQPGLTIIQDEPFFETNSNIDPDQVEIIRYFDTVSDEFHVVANGVLLTPLISPIRRRDKKLGFYKIVFEPFSDSFFWGRSFPDKIMQLQDVDNTLLNAMLDQLYLSIFKPILTTKFGNLSSEALYADSVVQVDDINEVKEMQRTGPESVAFSMFGLVQGRIDVGSVDPIKQGQTIGKGKTATEVERAMQSAGQIQSLFQSFAKWGVREKALLRCDTIIQFYFRHRKKSDKVYKEFVVENVKLTNDQLGDQIIRIKDKQKLAPKNKVGFSQELAEENLQNIKPSEIIEITPEYMDDIEYDCELIVDDMRVTEALRDAFTREFVQVAFARPDLFDQDYAARQFASVMKQDTDLALAKGTKTPGLFSDLPGSEMANAMVPAQKAAVPSLKSLLGSSNAGGNASQMDMSALQ